MNPNILGLDLSLVETGAYCYDPVEGGEVFQTIVTSKPNPDVSDIQRINTILAAIQLLIDRANPSLVCIEGLSYGSKNTSSLCQLAMLSYAVQNYLLKNGIQYAMVPPTTLKKFTTGKGNAKKEQMLLQIFKRWGKEFSNNNLADAFALAKWGERSFQQE